MIFEDADGDGRFEVGKVFLEGLNLVSGLEVGFGGVWVGAAPYLLFVPDRNGDGRPDGPPVTLLDGFGYHDTHETLNSFIWGPDGWLYGCHGVFTHSTVGKPGTPLNKRTRINAGIWRVPSNAARVRSLCRGDQQSLGRRFQRPWRGVLHRLRHPAPLLPDPRRPVPAASRRTFQSQHLRRHQDDRRPSPLAGQHAPLGQQPLRRGRWRARPRRRHGLPRRKLAQRVSR